VGSVIEVARQIRSGSLNFGYQHYSLVLLHGVLQAQTCGYKKITAVEFGVGSGNGLISLSKAAKYFQENIGIEIEVVGFDNATGLPPSIGDYRDHPEIWNQGDFSMGKPDSIRSQLSGSSELIVGDVADTLPKFIETFSQRGSKLGFVSLDLDYYSSSRACLPIFEMDPALYIPAVPIYVDDMSWHITYSEHAGVQLAMKEFNQARELRKIEAKPNFNIDNFHVCQVFDHPMRTGEIKPVISMGTIMYKSVGQVHANPDCSI
jgi:hypothetical protein